MAGERVYNFSAGPSMLPLPVLEEVQREMLNYKGTGMSVMEMSHRSKEFMSIFNQTEQDLRDVFDVPGEYKVMFIQGGATLQFAAIPLNMLGKKTKADYLVTGHWGELSQREAVKYCKSQEVCNTRLQKFTTIPEKADWSLDPEAAYVHYCSNETVAGVEFSHTPEVGDVPLVGDMSSNIGSRPIDVRKHAYIYASLQKNLGPAGVCLGIVRDDFASGMNEHAMCPTYCSWKACAENGSMYNTPACFTLYVVGEYLKYTKKLGGISHWEDLQDKKSRLIYDVIDSSYGFYSCAVKPHARSRINIPFKITGGDNVELDQKFIDEAKKADLCTLAGHKWVGGMRASLYNGMPLEGVEKLHDFMLSFMDENRN